ncbi:37040_t:CDS:1 [Gigaspora margarita]|uniref:37040_t:CDS:1 n=1 Tax=Gigaspora margarita TaxID=4874 RepID=A0ABN7VXN4_GIGMA|nr:37040_t:CDS:1 [Gigaspora margarita]
MDSSLTDPYCNGCKKFKPINEFMGNDINNIPTKFLTCNCCRQKSFNKWKRSKTTDDTLFNDKLEIIELDFLSKSVVEILENTQSNSDFHFHCGINIRNYIGSNKDLASEIVEQIENIDEYNWSYNRQYNGNKLTTYWYMCSQRDILQKKPHKNPDKSKQRDITSMERFECGGILKISIDKTKYLAKVTLHHKELHSKLINLSTPQYIKDFIKDNINLLPREIYAHLINKDQNLSLMIRQKQIHYWWVELGQSRYRRHNDALESAYLWLHENL